MITLLKLLELTDSCVVFDAAVAPPIGVDPVVYLTVAHFSRLFIISKSVIVGCSVSNLCLNEKYGEICTLTFLINGETLINREGSKITPKGRVEK